jgi:hypothetical protein
VPGLGTHGALRRSVGTRGDGVELSPDWSLMTFNEAASVETFTVMIRSLS